jgi:hypothetical protein
LSYCWLRHCQFISSPAGAQMSGGSLKGSQRLEGGRKNSHGKL